MVAELRLFGSEEPPTAFVEDVGSISDISESVINQVVSELPENWGLGIDEEERNRIGMMLANQDIAPDDQDSLIRFLQIVSRQAAKYDLSDSDVRDDFRELELDVTKWKDAINEIYEQKDEIRTGLSQFSRRNGLPRLRETRWQVSADEATGIVRYLNARRGQITLVLQNTISDEQKLVTFEIPEDESQTLDQMISELQELRELLNR